MPRDEVKTDRKGYTDWYEFDGFQLRWQLYYRHAYWRLRLAIRTPSGREHSVTSPTCYPDKHSAAATIKRLTNPKHQNLVASYLTPPTGFDN